MLTINDLDLNGIDAVIFDLDGTLYNKRKLARRLVFGELGRLGIFARERIARKELKGQAFDTKEAFFSAFFNAMGKHKPFYAACARLWYTKDYMPLMIRTLRFIYKVEPWALQLVLDLKAAGKKVAVYSDYDAVPEKLHALGIDPTLFDVAVSAMELGGLKPAQQPMERLLQMLNEPAERCLMVGDRDDTDGESARAVGARFCLVNNNPVKSQTQTNCVHAFFKRVFSYFSPSVALSPATYPLSTVC